MTTDAQLIVLGRRGRPSRAGVPSIRRMAIKITEAEHADLKSVAHETRQPLAAVIRDAVNEFVADYRDKVVFRK